MGTITTRAAIRSVAVTLAVLAMTNTAVAQESGDSRRGAELFRACAACHSLEPGRHMTGPSLAGLRGRKAGSVRGFARYSPALKRADMHWNARTLDDWLADPQGFIPGNTMAFAGIREPKARADLIAFLTADGSREQTAQGGMMRSPTLPNLKSPAPSQRVTAIHYCGDSYRVTTAVGELPPFWEFNLRFKTDSSDTGPMKGQPAIVAAGMMGDRASVIFADPAEISAFIERRC